MKKITITLYSFEELPQATQKQVTQKLSGINVDYTFWYEYSYEHFKKLCALLGVGVEAKSLHFNGFYAQGDGSCFGADVDIVGLIEGIRSRVWTSSMPASELEMQAPDISPSLFSLIKKGGIDISAKIYSHSNGIGIEAGMDWNYDSSKNLSNIDKSFLDMESWFQKTSKTLNDYLYRSLQAEYEFVTSEQSVAETITANEYLFTIDGEPAFHLEPLAD
ncbi:hypothetical protein [Dyadobacter sp. 3J3]|uniref:hypothetical protein n=1 Tax=Dyadobacter sp. 3J3 TaxID=2606600 RepID=UPI00135B9114|nr:hypothetical protein [Dyadobacter sp. 3J3]